MNCVFLVFQIQWTANCTQALFQAKSMDTKKPLKKIRKIMKNVLSSFTDAIRGELKKVDRFKIVALVTIEIHARDVIDKMYKTSKNVLNIIMNDQMKINLKHYDLVR